MMAAAGGPEQAPDDYPLRGYGSTAQFMNMLGRKR
jgi:hypothetical protein